MGGKGKQSKQLGVTVTGASKQSKPRELQQRSGCPGRTRKLFENLIIKMQFYTSFSLCLPKNLIEPSIKHPIIWIYYT